jgi:hypothetical protein
MTRYRKSQTVEIRRYLHLSYKKKQRCIFKIFIPGCINEGIVLGGWYCSTDAELAIVDQTLLDIQNLYAAGATIDDLKKKIKDISAIENKKYASKAATTDTAKASELVPVEQSSQVQPNPAMAGLDRLFGDFKRFDIPTQNYITELIKLQVPEEKLYDEGLWFSGFRKHFSCDLRVRA